LVLHAYGKERRRPCGAILPGYAERQGDLPRSTEGEIRTLKKEARILLCQGGSLLPKGRRTKKRRLVSGMDGSSSLEGERGGE